MVRAICETSSVWVNRVRYRSPSGERNTCVFCLRRRKALQCSTRSRSRWNTGRSGSCGSGTTLPRLASLKVAHGAKVRCSISSVLRRTSIQILLLFFGLLPSPLRTADPNCCATAIVAHRPCRRGKFRVGLQKRLCFLKWCVERVRHRYLSAAPGQFPQLLQQRGFGMLRHLPAQGDPVCKLRRCLLCPGGVNE